MRVPWSQLAKNYADHKGQERRYSLSFPFLELEAAWPKFDLLCQQRKRLPGQRIAKLDSLHELFSCVSAITDPRPGHDFGKAKSFNFDYSYWSHTNVSILICMFEYRKMKKVEIPFLMSNSYLFCPKLKNCKPVHTNLKSRIFFWFGEKERQFGMFSVWCKAFGPLPVVQCVFRVS